jgi:hypothetical protein
MKRAGVASRMPIDLRKASNHDIVNLVPEGLTNRRGWHLQELSEFKIGS